jgi:Fe-S cluster biogenesis protein NfuA
MSGTVKAQSVEQQVRDALDLIRPAIQMDGGDVRLEAVEGGVVTLQLLGVCEGCPISPVTLRQGVERIVKERVPGITDVVAVEA